MSLKAKVKAAVNKAFTAADDLVVSGTLSSKSVTGYDFATRSTSSTTKSIPVKVILETVNRSGESAFNLQAIMKSGTNISLYDSLTVGTDVYNITSFADDSFVITLQLVKEKA